MVARKGGDRRRPQCLGSSVERGRRLGGVRRSLGGGHLLGPLAELIEQRSAVSTRHSETEEASGGPMGPSPPHGATQVAVHCFGLIVRGLQPDSARGRVTGGRARRPESGRRGEWGVGAVAAAAWAVAAST